MFEEIEQVNFSHATEPRANSKPLWWWVARSYLAGFRQRRHELTVELMPFDKRLIRATRAVYNECSEPDKAVMRGDFEGTFKELRARQNRLIALLAIKAGLTAAAIIPIVETEETEEEKKNESDKQKFD